MQWYDMHRENHMFWMCGVTAVEVALMFVAPVSVPLTLLSWVIHLTLQRISAPGVCVKKILGVGK